MSRDFPDTNPHVDKLVSLYDLASEPVDLFVRGMNSGLDYAGLSFGKKYRVTQDLNASRSGALRRGEKVYFLGYYVFPHDDGLRLHLEQADGTKCALEFDGSRPEAPGTLRMMTRGADYFAPVTFDFSKRHKQLTAARAVVLHMRKKEAQP